VLDRHFAAATIAHEYLADLHLELAALGTDSHHTRALLGESAAVVTERMPALTRELRYLGEEWETQNLLAPPWAKRTLQVAETCLIETEPEHQSCGRARTRSSWRCAGSSSEREEASAQRPARRAAAASSQRPASAKLASWTPLMSLCSAWARSSRARARSCSGLCVLSRSLSSIAATSQRSLSCNDGQGEVDTR
jgi:hypothetical protein